MRRGASFERGEQFRASLAPGLGEEVVTVCVEQLRQRDVVAGARFRPGSHRDAEARAARFRAVDGDDNGRVAPCGVALVADGAPGENAIGDAKRGQFAGPDSQKRGLRCVCGQFADRERLAVAVRLPDPLLRREEEALERRGPDDVAEVGVVGTPREPVAAGLVNVGPADGKVGKAGDVSVDDRSFADRWTDDAIAARAERVEQCL